MADRLDPILSPLGFTFSIDQAGVSSGGAFASGFYSGGGIKIGLIYRADSGLGGVIYEDSRYNVSHTNLMERLGHADDCKLAYDRDRLASYSKDGGDTVDALIYDLQNFGLNVLAGDRARLDQIIKDAQDEWLRKWDIRPRAGFVQRPEAEIGQRPRGGFGQRLKDALAEWLRKWGLRR